MDLDDLSRQLECAISAKWYDKAKQVIEQIKLNEDYVDPDNQSLSNLIIRKEVQQAEAIINTIEK